MAQSLSKILVHIVFSTKNRKQFIDQEIESELHAYLAGICKNNNSKVFKIGGMEDHIHLACTLPRTLAPSNLIAELKRSSSKWMKVNKNQVDFSWQSGFGIFSFSESQIPLVINYIEKQKEHHQKISFQDELRILLNKYNIDYDEDYLWD